MRYYLAKLTKDWIGVHPNWVYRIAGDRKPKYFGEVQKNDRIVVYAYAENETDPLSRVHELWGFFRVRKKMYKKNLPRLGEHWIIEGERLRTSPQDFLKIPPPSRFVGHEIFNQEIMTRIDRKTFRALENYVQKYENANWGILGKEPENEQGVVVLFSKYLSKLGFQTIRIQTRFPDAQVLGRSGKPTNIEFEYGLRGARLHSNRPLYKSATYVFWFDNWTGKDKPRHLFNLKERLFPILNP